MMDRQAAKEKAREALELAAETDDPKQAQAIAVISTHWLAIAGAQPDTNLPGVTAESYL